MNQKSNIHAVIIGLLVICLLLTGGGIFLLNTQLNELKRTISPDAAVVAPPTPSPTSAPGSSTKKYYGWDLSFDYPKEWYVVRYNDEFVSGQKNIRITSSPGTLESAASWFETVGAEYEEGFLADMRLFAAGQSQPSTVPTTYSNIKKITGDCDAISCPNEQYVFQGSKGNYLIRFKYTDSTWAKYVETILSSLME